MGGTCWEGSLPSALPPQPSPLTSLFAGKLTRMNLQTHFNLIIFENVHCINAIDSLTGSCTGNAQEDRVV